MRDVVVYTLLFSAMIQLLMAAYTWGRRNEPVAKSLIALFVLCFVWTFAYAMDMASDNLGVKIFWTQIYWTAASFGPLLFTLIIFEHLEITHLLTRRRLALLLIPPIVTLLLAWTMRFHDLLLYGFVIIHANSLVILQSRNGIMYMPILLILQGTSLVAYYFLIRSLRNANYIKWRQSITILCALLVPFFANIPTILRISPVTGFDFTPYFFVLSSVLFALAIFRYKWLDVIPMARNTLVEIMPVGVLVLDGKHRIVDMNPSAMQILEVTNSIIGSDAETMIGKQISLNLQTSSTRYLKNEVEMQKADENIRNFDIHTIPLISQAGELNGHILLLHDVTEQKQAKLTIEKNNEYLQRQLAQIELLHNELHEQAVHDSLTKLFNRGYLNDALDREVHRAQRHQHPISVLMIEIDDFKLFNDNFGHDAGDAVLQKVAALIQASTRRDDIACRFGGDEFTMILPLTTLEMAQECAERLRESACHLTVFHEDRQLKNLTISIGIATYPNHGATGLLTLRAADKAMYRAKLAGKNRVMTAEID
jgi:diguanylate cyclase (GGDEF)-like protein